MRKFLRKLRKGLKTACLTAALTTCWNIGQTAKADFTPPGWGDEINLSISGTISPTTNDVYHLYLVYGTNYSFHMSWWTVDLGDFPAGQDSSFSVEKTATYWDGGIFLAFAGLYGDISSGQYNNNINGVTLGIHATEGDSWDSHAPYVTEENMFAYIFNDDQEQLMDKADNIYYWHDEDISDGIASDTITLFDFSAASQNGQIQLDVMIVPEPVSIILFGTGGIIVAALNRRKYLKQ